MLDHTNVRPYGQIPCDLHNSVFIIWDFTSWLSKVATNKGDCVHRSTQFFLQWCQQTFDIVTTPWRKTTNTASLDCAKNGYKNAWCEPCHRWRSGHSEVETVISTEITTFDVHICGVRPSQSPNLHKTVIFINVVIMLIWQDWLEVATVELAHRIIFHLVWNKIGSAVKIHTDIPKNDMSSIWLIIIPSPSSYISVRVQGHVSWIHYSLNLGKISPCPNRYALRCNAHLHLLECVGRWLSLFALTAENVSVHQDDLHLASSFEHKHAETWH